ncbi:MAG: adenylate/guanylate cyclase domain-containing protein [Chloroflexota bacterium]
MRCVACGEENADRSRFCLSCGLALTTEAQSDAAISRRIVTVLFADMVGSTGFAESLDAEIVRAIQERYFIALRTTIERHGGVVEKFIGDAVMAVFGWPRAHEDDALRAVRAAAGFPAALEAANVDLRSRGLPEITLRVGVSTGPVVALADTTDALVTGDTVNVAARLEQAAAPGQILLGIETYRLVRDVVDVEPLGTIPIRGRAVGTDAFRVRSVGEAGIRVRDTDLPLVGRGVELAELRAGFGHVAKTGRARMSLILGPAGTGKSRLAREFLAEVDARADVLRGRCLPYGDGITYWPIAEILRDVGGLPADAPVLQVLAGVERRLGVSASPRLGAVIAAVLGASADAVDRDEIVWGFCQLLGVMARAKPVVVLIEDLHWADASLLRLLEATLEWGPDGLYLVATSRSDLLEDHPNWPDATARSERIDLRPLEQNAVDLLLDSIPAGRALGPILRARINDAADGNPLFLEEFVGMLIDQGHLRDEDGAWVAGQAVESLPIPPTIAALLAARLDALQRSEQNVIGCGSVIGRSFERGAVATLSVVPEGERLAATLLNLLHRDLIIAGPHGVDGGDSYRFRHILIRDAAYERLSKSERARLHEGFVAWLDAVVWGEAHAVVEIAAHHLAQAAEYRWELAPHEAATVDLSERAIERLVAAAGRAERVAAFSETTRHLGRAIRLADRLSDLQRRRDLRSRRAGAAHLAGEMDEAIAAAREAIDLLSPQAGMEEARLLGALAIYLEAYGDSGGALETLDRGLAIASSGGGQDRLSLLNQKARFLMLGNAASEARELAEEAVRLARETNAEVELSNGLSTLGITLMMLGDRESALERLTEARAVATRTGDPVARVRSSINLTVVRNGGPRRVDLHKLNEANIAEAEALGLSRYATANLINAAYSAWWAGDPQRAKTYAQRLIDQHVPSEHTAFAWHLVSASQAAQGRFAEAQEAAATSRDWLRRLDVPPREVDYEITEAEIALAFGRPQSALAILAAGLERGGGADPDKLAQLLLVGLRAAVDAVIKGESKPVSPMGTAQEIADGMRRLRLLPAGTLSWEGFCALDLVDAELSRLGPTQPTIWREAAAREHELNVPTFEAYALWRWVEALREVAASAEEVCAAATIALEAARRVEAGHLVRSLEAVAQDSTATT